MVGRRKAAIHRHHFLFRDTELRRDQLDLLGPEITILDRLDVTLGLAQVEEQLLLRRRGADLHEAPRTQDVLLDRGLDPPHRIGRKAEALVGLEALHGLHEADIALRNDLVHRQPVAAIAHGNLRNQAQVARHQLVRRRRVLMLAPTLGEHVFLFRFQHRKVADFSQIAAQSAFSKRQIASSHFSLPCVRTSRSAPT